MNRTALTIKMLNYLKAHDVVSRSELAVYLETNIRNIAEFKKELEIAGYSIDTIHGAYGGYRLDESSLIPTLALEDKEIKVLNETSKYLIAKQFKYANDFDAAMVKIKGNLRNPSKSNDVYYLRSNVQSNIDYEMTQNVEKARDLEVVLSFQYKKLNGKVWNQRLVQPYELINTSDGFYVLAYDVTPDKDKMFKHFKITKSRMKEIILTSNVFIRDSDFKIQDYVGKQGLFREVYEVELEVRGKQARLLNESNIGLSTKKRMMGDVLYLSFQMEHKMRIIEFILSLGFECTVIKPIEIKEEVIINLKDTLSQYMV